MQSGNSENSSPHFQDVAHTGACGKTRVALENRWPKPEFSESGDCHMRIQSTSDHAVIVAGGGPTGLMLAGELSLTGVDVAIVERRRNQELVGSRAGGLHSRTIEVLDQRGIADRFLSLGQVAQVGGFSQIRLDISDFPTRHAYGLALWQSHIERVLAEWVDELGVSIYRAHEVTGVLLEFDRRAGLDAAAWTGRVRHVAAEYIGGWELPVLGRVGAPAAVLVRPDGYVAWVGDGTDAGLVEALTMCFGAPAG
jgi:hypothetical protein